MRSDVPCAEAARLVSAVGFPITLACSRAPSGTVWGQHGDGCDQRLWAGQDLRAMVQAERISSQTKLNAVNRIEELLRYDVCCLQALQNGDPDNKWFEL